MSFAIAYPPMIDFIFGIIFLQPTLLKFILPFQAFFGKLLRKEQNRGDQIIFNLKSLKKIPF